MSELQIPKGWELKKTSDIIEILYGKGLSKDERDESGKFPVYGSNGVVGTHSEYLIDFPSIIIGRKGSVGAINLTPEKFWPTDVTYYVQLFDSKIPLKIIYYLLIYLNLPRLVQSGPKPGLNRNDVYNLHFLFPSSNDIQKKIVAKLDYIFSQLEEKKKQIISRIEKFDAKKITQNYKNHLLKLAFDGTLTGEEPGEIIDGIQIPKGWKMRALQDACESISSGGTPNRSNSEYFGGSIPWLKIGDLNNRGISDSNEKITEVGLENSSAKLFPKDTVLFAMYGATIGKTGILEKPCATNQAICGMRCSDVLLPNYLLYFLQSKYHEIRKMAEGGAQPNINQNKLKTLKFGLPPLETQKKIVKIIDQKFADWENHKQELENIQKRHESIKKHLSDLSSSILNDVFSGKLVH